MGVICSCQAAQRDDVGDPVTSEISTGTEVRQKSGLLAFDDHPVAIEVNGSPLVDMDDTSKKDSSAIEESSAVILKAAEGSPSDKPLQVKAQQSADEVDTTDSVPNQVSVESLECLGDIEALVKAGEWGEAELSLLDWLDSAGSTDAEQLRWVQIEGLPWVQDTVGHSRIFWEARQLMPDPAAVAQATDQAGEAAQEGFPGWTPLPKVRIDYPAIVPGTVPSMFAHINPFVRILWRSHRDKMMLKFLTEFPSFHPILHQPFVVSFFSLWAEVDKWSSWNPVVSGVPQLLKAPSVDHQTWISKTYIPFLTSEAGVGEMFRMFSPEGFVVQKVQSVMDPEDERNKRMVLPKGYTRKKQEDYTMTIAVLGSEKTVLVIHYEVDVGEHPPSQRITNFILNMVAPSLAKKMFRNAAETFTLPFYQERMQEDVSKVYARISQANNDGQAREERTKVKFDSSNTRVYPEAFRAGDLYGRSLKRSLPQAIPETAASS
eukprot:TRINITY_DN44273_c0_g1_i1.p1 TRINITY_DN44273_c0_g1~~TRINITY_DN44273_c0_g1_i1.p1  ORF type:complete len:489 (+),score=76.78 TRINITY_DN44273_c0_g1_i1:111-1577(+)